MDSETAELIKQHKENEKKKPEMPFWCYRDENGNVKVNFKSLGDLIQREHNYLFIMLKDKETLYEYNSKLGYWFAISNGSINKAIHDKLVEAKQWSSTTQSTTYKFIYSGIERKTFNSTLGKAPRMAFNFLNGIYNWENDKLEPHNKEYYFEGCTNYALNMDKMETPETDKYFNLLFGENAKTMMEFIGYMFYPSYEPIQCFLILKNEGGDGKTWFTNHIINSMLGSANVANISLNQLANEKDNKFKLKELFHKNANISSELSEDESKILPTATVKKLSGNDNFNGDVKGKDDINFANYAKMLILTNTLIHFRDDSDGFRRRANIMPAHKIPNFESTINERKIKEERGIFAYKCIRLAKEAIKRGDLTKTDSIKKMVNDWILDNDPVQQFINDCIIKAPGKKENALDVIQAWKNWCKENDYIPLGKTNFKNKMIKKGFNYHIERPRDQDGNLLPRQYYFTNMKLNENANPKGSYNPEINRFDFNK